jgi:hypothetical protein
MKDGAESAPAVSTKNAHRHSIRNRTEIERSVVCGCFYCLRTFGPDAIRPEDWIDEGVGCDETARCPFCGIDSVIGSESGYPITPEFLATMHGHWF